MMISQGAAFFYRGDCSRFGEALLFAYFGVIIHIGDDVSLLTGGYILWYNISIVWFPGIVNSP